MGQPFCCSDLYGVIQCNGYPPLSLSLSLRTPVAFALGIACISCRSWLSLSQDDGGDSESGGALVRTLYNVRPIAPAAMANKT